jgi:hypothetical protein
MSLPSRASLLRLPANSQTFSATSRPCTG